jgi:hypothetical protein
MLKNYPTKMAVVPHGAYKEIFPDPLQKMLIKPAII